MQNITPHHERSKPLSQPRLLREAVWTGQAPDTSPRDAIGGAELWRLLREHYLFVLLVGAGTFCLVMGVTLASPMQFRASGRLYLGELDSHSRQTVAPSEEIDLSGGGQGDVWSEVEIITSSGLVTRAIHESGVNVAIAPLGAQNPRFLPWLLARRDPHLLDAGFRELRAKDTDLGESVRHDATFRVRFTAPETYDLYSDTTRLAQGHLGDKLAVDNLKLTLVAGSERGPVVGRDYELHVTRAEDVYASTLKTLIVSVPKAGSTTEPVKVVTLTFTAGSPRAAADFLSTLMRGYLDARHSWKTEEATASEEFVTNQLATIRGSLDQIQDSLASYRSNNRVVVLDNEAKALIEQMGKYEEQRVAARLEVASLSNIKQVLKSSNPPLGAYLLGEADDTVLSGLAESLTRARQKLTDLDAQYNAAAPEVKQQRAQVEAQLDSIRNYVGSRLSRAQQMQGEIGGIINQFETRLKGVPGAEIGLARLTRESEVYSRLYSYLLERQQQTAIVKASTVSKNRVLDTPEPPTREDSPKLALRLASGPVGLLLGVLLLVGRALFSDTFQTEAELKRALGAVPIWGRIPRKQKKSNRRAFAARSFELPFEPPEEHFDEAFRTLRTNLFYAQAEEAPRIVLITSPHSGDGKTTAALSLAALLAAEGRRTLVVDVDLRRPTYCVGHDEPSLDTALRGECAWRDAVHRIATSYGEFDALGASAPNAPELLSSPAMAVILAEARESYDVVVLDATSFPLFSDAAVLARTADCVLSVVALARTPRRVTAEYLHGMASLARRQAVVVNGVRGANTKRRGVHRAQLPPSPSAPLSIPLRRRVRRVASVGMVVFGLVGALAAVHASSGHSWREAASRAFAGVGFDHESSR